MYSYNVLLRTFWCWTEAALDIANNLYQLKKSFVVCEVVEALFYLVLLHFKLTTRVKDGEDVCRKEERPNPQAIFYASCYLFSKSAFLWSGNWSVYVMMQFKYRIKPILACEKNCSNVISAIPVWTLQEHSVSVLGLIAFGFIFLSFSLSVS